MDTTIDEVSIQIDSNSQSASQGLDNLTNTITKLKTSLDSGLKSLNSFNNALSSLKEISSGVNIKNDSFKKISDIQNIGKNNDISNLNKDLKEVSQTTQNIKDVKIDTSNIQQAEMDFLNLKNDTVELNEELKDIPKSLKSIGGVKTKISDFLSSEQIVKVNNWQRQLQIATNQAEIYKNKINELSKQLQSSPEGSEKYSKLKQELEKTVIQFQQATAKAQNLQEKIRLLNTNAGMTKMQNSMKNINNVTNRIVRTLGKVFSAFKRVGNVASQLKSKIGNVFNNKDIDRGFKKILKYGFALFSIRGTYALLNSAANRWLSSTNKSAQLLSANMDYLKFAAGSALAPVIEYLINLVYALLKGIQKVAYALTGVNIFANATASSMKSASNSAKEMKKQLAPFDELNVIDFGNASGSGTGEIGPSLDLSELDNATNSILEAIKNGDWYGVGMEIGKKINETLESIDWDAVKKKANGFATNFGNLINGLVDGTNWSLVGSTIGEGLNTAVGATETFLKTVKWEDLGKAVASTVNSFVKTTDWSDIGSTIGAAITAAAKVAHNFFKDADFKELAKGVVTSINTFLTSTDWSEVGKAIGSGIQSAIDYVHTLVTQFDWGELGKDIATTLNNIIEETDFKEAGQALGRAIKGIFTSLSTFLQDTNWEEVGKSIADFITGIEWTDVAKAIIDAIGDAIVASEKIEHGFATAISKAIAEGITGIEFSDDDVQPFVKKFEKFTDAIKDVLWTLNLGPIYWLFFKKSKNNEGEEEGQNIGKNLIEGLKTGLESGKQAIIQKWNEVKGWFTDIVKNAYVAITQKWEDIKQAWQNLTGNIKDKVANMKAAVTQKWEDIQKDWNNIVGNVKDKVANMKAWVATKKDDFKKSWYKVSDVVKSKTAKMKAKVSTTASSLKKAWDKTVSVVKDIVTTVTIKISPIIENIKGWLNTNFINKINDKLPSWFPKIPQFAEGGFPEMGELFIAREAGPELVGNIGTKAAVANNDQIIEGIRQASYQAFSEALKENNSDNRSQTNIYLGNKKLYSGYGEYADSESNRYGKRIIKV